MLIWKWLRRIKGLPGQSSSCLSGLVYSALPSPPASAPAALVLLGLLRADPAAGSAQDEIPEGDPTTRGKRGPGVNRKRTGKGVRAQVSLCL